MEAWEQKFAPQRFHSLVHKGSASNYRLPCDFWHSQRKGNGDAKLWKSLPSWAFDYKSIMVSFPPLVGSHSHLYPAGLANVPFLLLGEHILLQCKGRPRQTAGSERAGEPGLARGQLSCVVREARRLPLPLGQQKSRMMPLAVS